MSDSDEDHADDDKIEAMLQNIIEDEDAAFQKFSKDSGKGRR